MRKKIFTLISATFVAAGAWAQITALPFNTDFEESIAPFDAGNIVTATDYSNVFHVSNTTATAAFNIGGTDAYAISENEEVTIAFTALHGWVGSSKTSTISLLNSEGVELVGYTYNINATQVTDVVIGGKTADGFTPFMGQANWNNNKSANGYNHNQHFSTNEDYSPKVTMKIHGQGAVTFSFKYTAAKSQKVDVNLSANLSGVKMDLAKIVITDNCDNEQRSFCMDNLSITSEQKVLYKYAINYVDEADKVVKVTEGAALEGTKIAIEGDVVWADGVKYYILSNDSEQNPVDNTNNTAITVKCKKAPVYKYTVSATDGTDAIGTIAEGEYYEGETVGYAYPRYFCIGGTLFKKDPTDQVYNGTFLLDADNKTVETAYASTETTNVICYVEAETIEGLTVCNTSTVADRCSNRAGAYTASQAPIVTLTAGTYTLTAAAYGGTYSFMAGENEVLNIPSAGSWRETKSEPFTLNATTALTFAGGTGTAGSLDYVVIQSEDGMVTTAIESPRIASDKTAVYNMNGQRVSTPAHGLYIVNGKKVLY